MINFFTKDKTVGNKKIVENMVLFLVLFIIVIVVINSLGEQEYDSAKVNTNINQTIEVTNNKEETLEEKLASILSQIDGAGKVNVLITYSKGIEQIPMYNIKKNTITTEEADNAGGTRKTEEINNEQNVIFNENGNNKTPVIKQTINPEIIGVIVVAEGADNINVKENMIKAVEASLNVPFHRIQVFARKK